jgi:arylformamidase
VNNHRDVRWIGGDYRRSELDAEHEQGAFVADPSPWLDVWRKGTERARRRTAEVRVDISYGNRESERFDLYLPTHQPRRLPFAAFVHGGEWRRAMRADSGYPAKAIHRQGAAFIVIGFDAVPAIDLAGQVDQVRRAWRYLVENAARFGLDPTRGHLVGHSSGAHLAALAAFDPQGFTPVSVVLLSGIYDLEPVRLSTRNRHLDLGSETVARLSPIRCISSVGPTVLVAWGGREPDEFRRQSQDFASACKVRGLRVIQGELPGRGHVDTSLELANPHSQVLATLRA